MDEVYVDETVWMRMHWMRLMYVDENVNVNVTDTILWQGHPDRVMQLN